VVAGRPCTIEYLRRHRHGPSWMAA